MDVNNFNLIAPFYDRLARLVFGKSILRAQLTYLSEIKEADSVLILGGGTGKILEHLPFCEHVDYIEKSKKMIKRSRRRLVNRSINFINEDFLKVESEKKYNVIICPFFLDCFNLEKLGIVLEKIKLLLNPKGQLIVIDFRKTRTNGLQLKLMHLFFRLFANLEPKYLLNIHEQVDYAGFTETKAKFSHRNQLFSRLYRNL